MTGQEVIEKLAQYASTPPRSQLIALEHLLEGLGNPQANLKYIQVEGDKGSVPTMLYHVYHRCEYRVGLFQYPPLYSPLEQIQVEGANISLEDWARLGEKVLSVCDTLPKELCPSQWEISFAIALVYFQLSQVEVAIWEGEAEMSQLLGMPVLTVLGTLSQCQQGEALPDTLIPPAGKVVLRHQEDWVMDQVKELCSRRGASLAISRDDMVKKVSQKAEMQKFTVDNKPYYMSLLGEEQRENVALVLEAVQVLKGCAFGFSQNGIFAGIARCTWQGHLERVHISPDFFLSICHRVEQAEEVLATLQELYAQQKVTFLLGFQESDPYEEILDVILPYASRIIAVTPPEPRGLKREVLGEYVQKYSGVPLESLGDLDEAVANVLQNTESQHQICALACVSVVGEIRHILGLC